MPRGRPVKSLVRQHMIEVLAFLGSASGYDIYKVYRAVYPKCTLRLMYYHLKQGLVLGVFVVDKIEKTTGNYSWGKSAEKTLYKLGPKAKPKMDKRVKEHLEKQV
jgi:hypothetical protein